MESRQHVELKREGRSYELDAPSVSASNIALIFGVSVKSIGVCVSCSGQMGSGETGQVCVRVCVHVYWGRGVVSGL